jgi:hypothetical protein
MAGELNIVGNNRCRFLTSKEMFYRDVDYSAPFRSSSGNGWCAQTQCSTGPDGKLVEAANCDSSRSCFQGV